MPLVHLNVLLWIFQSLSNTLCTQNCHRCFVLILLWRVNGQMVILTYFSFLELLFVKEVYIYIYILLSDPTVFQLSCSPFEISVCEGHSLMCKQSQLPGIRLHAVYVFYACTKFLYFLPMPDGVKQYVRFSSVCLTAMHSFVE
jgi:hypothetical protein